MRPSMFLLPIFLAVFLRVVRAEQQQDIIPADFYYSSETIFSELYRKDQLYDVTMEFDETYDPHHGGTKKGWSPPLPYFYNPNYWKMYLEPNSSLGFFGPLGYAGPLSTNGPLIAPGTADLPQKPRGLKENVIDSFKTGPLFSSPHQVSGPLGPDGPLGYLGPLTFNSYYYSMYHLNEFPFNANAFPINLDLTGVWGILGPLSALGALGPLGPLGNLGPFGLTRDGEGNFHEGGQLIREISMQFDHSLPPTFRTYSLFEFYPEAHAKRLSFENDASFMLEGTLSLLNETDLFPFTSPLPQLISIIVSPQASGTLPPEHFTCLHLQIAGVDGAGVREVLMASESCSYVNFIVFQGRKGGRYEVEVSAVASIVQDAYRLFVVGAGFLEGKDGQEVPVSFDHWNIRGEHQKEY